MAHYRLALVGFGNVGRALARLLLRKQDELEDHYRITFRITGISTGRHGAAINPDGLNIARALSLVENGQNLSVMSGQTAPSRGVDFVRACPADVLFENTPVDHQTGQPAVDHLRTALEAGMHAITANKGPVVHAYNELTSLAAKMGRSFRFESSVMDGAPIFSLFRRTLPLAHLYSFTGILNSCTNLILERMEGGETFDQAVAYAQSIGIAETDPSGDVDGWDAAIKVAALVTVLMGFPLTPQQVPRQGIRGLTPETLAQARQEGKRWKLVCTAEQEAGLVHTSVAPQMVPADSPLFSVGGTSSFVQFHTDTLPGLGILEGNPGPDTTAYGLLADFIDSVC